jgi:hypothetical protein
VIKASRAMKARLSTQINFFPAFPLLFCRTPAPTG